VSHRNCPGSVSRLFLDHGTRVEVSRTMFLVSKRPETGAEVSQSVLMPKCPVTNDIEQLYIDRPTRDNSHNVI